MLFLGSSKKEIKAEQIEILNNVYNGFENSLLNYNLNCNSYFSIIDTNFDKRIRSKSLLTKSIISKLLLNSNYIELLNDVTYVTSFYDSNGYFILQLKGNDFEIVFSGCNCGYVGEGSNASFEILKPLFTINNLDSSSLLCYIECNHFLNIDLNKKDGDNYVNL